MTKTKTEFITWGGVKYSPVARLGTDLITIRSINDKEVKYIVGLETSNTFHEVKTAEADNDKMKLTEMVEFSIPMVIHPQEIDDIIASALEGGINYWATSAKPKGNNYKGAKYASHCVSRGGSLIIEDYDGDKHELTKDKVIQGIILNITERGGSSSFDYYDATDCDCIIQFGLFGKLIYG